MDIEKALATKPRPKSDTPKTLWLGFSVNGDSQAVVRQALKQAGITDMSAYVRGLVLTDLKARLAKTEPKGK